MNFKRLNSILRISIITICFLIIRCASFTTDVEERDKIKYDLLDGNFKKVEPDVGQFSDQTAQYDCSCQDGYCVVENGTSVCKCRSGWGLVPKTPVSDPYCEQCDCRTDANCTFEVDWSGQLNKYCTCAEGYEDIDGKCIGTCKKNPCLNGGRCEVKDDDIVCKCRAWYNGKFCEKCRCYGGSCVEEDGRSTCKCPIGYGWIETNYNPPHCQKCNCRHDYNCTFKLVDNEFKRKCICPSGYEATENGCKGSCEKNPCQNGGVCQMQGMDDIVCKCNKLFGGDRCENCKCKDGHCKLESGIDLCTCDPGWALVPRTFKTDPYCKKCDCLSGGSCTFSWGFFGTILSCVCQEGYENAEGSCQVIPYTSTLQTTEGINASTVENFTLTDLDDFSTSTAEGSTVTDLVNFSTPEIVEQSSTENVSSTAELSSTNLASPTIPQGISTPTDPCMWYFCQNSGICKAVNNRATCFCKEPFTGEYCEIRAGSSSRYTILLILLATLVLILICVVLFMCLCPRIL